MYSLNRTFISISNSFYFDYSGKCPQGYVARPDPKIACEQVDVNILCQSNFDCTTNAECIEGQCFCQNGFEAQGSICVDIDECRTNPNICGERALCCEYKTLSSEIHTPNI